MDVSASTDERCLKRTAKACGPDASTLALTRDNAWHCAGTVTKKPGSPGRARRKPLKPFAQGMPECFGEPVVIMLACFFILHARPRVRLKHPAFPAPSVFGRRRCACRTRVNQAARR